MCVSDVLEENFNKYAKHNIIIRVTLMITIDLAQLRLIVRQYYISFTSTLYLLSNKLISIATTPQWRDKDRDER